MSLGGKPPSQPAGSNSEPSCYTGTDLIVAPPWCYLFTRARVPEQTGRRRSAHIQPSPCRLPAKHTETWGETRCVTAALQHRYSTDITAALWITYIYIYIKKKNPHTQRNGTTHMYALYRSEEWKSSSVSSIRVRTCACARPGDLTAALKQET